MSGLHYYVVDTETTGLSAKYHEMTEIGIIRCIDRVQLHRNIKCTYPERANFDALKITNKTMADLEKGHEKSAVVAECNKFFAEDGASPAHRVIVAHNASFDRRFIHALYESVGEEFPAHLWLDTIALVKDYAKKIGLNKPKEGFGLHSACDIIGIRKFSDAHNAKVDSRNCFLLHRNLTEEKKVNYLPFIKTAIHSIQSEDIDMSILDDE
jgi:DNA polymerase III alpha subunit (gram-positive type)